MGFGHLEAGRLILHGAEMIAVGKGFATGRANNLVTQVSFYLVEFNLGIVGLFGFESPGLDRAVDLTQVTDAGIHLGCAAGFHKVRDGNGREEADYGHDDHDLNECEPLQG